VQCLLWKIIFFFFFFFNFLTQIFGFFLPIMKSQPGNSYHPSVPKEFKVLDNFNPDEPIPQNPHVTLWGLRTSLYVLRYPLCILIWFI
jgi:hypothetical protein